MSSFVDLNRASYLKDGTEDRLNYMSAHYLNIKFLVPPSFVYVVKISDVANAPGIAFNVYGDRGYWWIVCLYNGILEPISAFKPGTSLQLPSLSDINLFLTTQEQADGSNVITI